MGSENKSFRQQGTVSRKESPIREKPLGDTTQPTAGVSSVGSHGPRGWAGVWAQTVWSTWGPEEAGLGHKAAATAVSLTALLHQRRGQRG